MTELADVLLRRANASNGLYSWYNITGPYNGTDVEGGKSLDFGDFTFQMIVSNNIAVAALTLYIWEWLSTLLDEYRLYSTHKFTSRHVILFLLVRYGTLPSLILPAYSVWHNFMDDRQGCRAHQQLTICVVQLIVSIVFAWRTIAIWDHQRTIVIFFITTVCVQFGASFGLLWFSEEKLLPNGACMPVTPPNGFNPFPIFYAIAFAYDLLTILTSSYKLWKFSALGRQSSVERAQPIQWNSLSTSTRQIRGRVHQGVQGITESPLIQRLTHAGLVYFVVATSFNAVAFGLEISDNVHSKALITLYAPLMCILCQRIILLDVKAIWGKLDGRESDNNGTREQALVDRVMNERRLSWQGTEDSSVRSPRLDEKQQQHNSSGPSQHIAVEMNADSTSSPGMLAFQEMIQDTPTTPPSAKDGPQQESIASSSSETNASMTEDDRTTALRLAGFIK